MKKLNLFLVFLFACFVQAAEPVFPQQWKAFLNIGLDYVPGPAELVSIPETLRGKGGIVKKLENDRLDFHTEWPVPDDKNHAWLFAEMESLEAMTYPVGCGADWWFAFYLNGKEVYTTFPRGNAEHPPRITDHVFDLKLAKGRNVLAVKFRSGDATSIIAMGGGTALIHPKLTPQEQAQLAFYQKRGVPLTAKSVVPKNLKDKIAKGLAPEGYVVDSNWQKLLKPTVSTLIERHSKGKSLGKANVLSMILQGQDVTLRISGTPALTGEDVVYALVCSAKGNELYGRIGTIQELNGKIGQDGIATIVLPGLQQLVYGAAVEGRLQAGVCRRDVTGQHTQAITLGGKTVPGETAVLKIEPTPAGPTPMLNGKPFFFYCHTIHPYVPERTIPMGMEGSKSPSNVIAIRFGGNAASENWWFGPDQYDFTRVDWCLNSMMKDFPDSKLALYLWCHPGNWYARRYPERMSMDDQGKAPVDYYVSKVCFSNQEMQADTIRAIGTLVKHCETYFGSRIVLYNLMGGISCEWQGWNSHSGSFADYSEGSLRDFKAYAAAHGTEVDHIPTPKEHQRSDDGIFRKPAKDASTMLYDRFYSEAISHFIDRIAGAVKRNSNGNKLVGCYYGYHLEYSNMGYTINRAGHNDLQTLLQSPNIDFFLSPQSYAVRALGAPNADMKPYGAIRLANKFSIMEDDTRTHIDDECGHNQGLNLEQTLSLLTRNVGMYLCHRMPLNQLGEHGGDEMAAPELKEFFAKAVAAGQFIMEQKDPDPTQIAVVLDENSYQYLAARRKNVSTEDRDSYVYGYNGKLSLRPSRSILPLTGESIGMQRFQLAHCGAPIDIVLLEDIAANAGKYKVVIFLNVYRDSPALRKAFSALRAENAAIVVLYGAGFVEDNGISAEVMSELLGFQISRVKAGSIQLRFPDGRLCGAKYDINPRFAVTGKPGKVYGHYADTGEVAVACKDNAYFYGGASLDPAFVRELAREQGVHLYLDTEDNLYAGSHCISIHARWAGRKNISLPRKCTVVDAFSGETLARDANAFAVDMKATESRVFLLK